MTSEVKYAPKAVIEELDKYKFPSEFVAHWQSLHATDCVDKWLLSDEELLNDKFMAIMLHIAEDERLQPEREPRYYVAKEIDDFSLGVYYKGSQEEHLRHTTMTKGFPVNYREGFSRQLAEAIVAEFGGTIEEIK